MSRRPWAPIVEVARDIVVEYEYRITLRQLHYRLVMTQDLGYDNTEPCYKRLSSLTAEGRRNGSFPPLLDQTRQVHQARYWQDAADAQQWLADQYRLDRTEGQDDLVVLGGEKATLLAQLNGWFRHLGIPIVLLRGYGSQTYIDDVVAMVEDDGRDAVLIYAGDFDPSGEEILRDFVERCDVWAKVEHIAVLPEQVDEMGLVINAGKDGDSRAAGFVQRHGGLYQVEVEAIAPDDLRSLYAAALATYWETSAYEDVRAWEDEDRKRLLESALRLEDDPGASDPG